MYVQKRFKVQPSGTALKREKVRPAIQTQMM